jgi:hypothetical protein
VLVVVAGLLVVDVFAVVEAVVVAGLLVVVAGLLVVDVFVAPEAFVVAGLVVVDLVVLLFVGFWLDEPWVCANATPQNAKSNTLSQGILRARVRISSPL